MAKGGKNTVLALAFVALVGFFLIKQSIRIDVGTPSVSFLELAGNGIRINVRLPILNRSNFDYPIQGFLGLLMYGQTALGNVTLKQPITIQERSTAAPEFSALINYGALASETFQVLKDAGVIDWLLSKIGLGDASKIKQVAWKDFRIRGTLYISGVAIDIDQSLA